MRKNENTKQIEKKLNDYFQLSASISTKPLSDAKILLPLGAAMFGALSSLEAAIVYSGVQNVSIALVGATNRGYVNIDLAGGNDFEIHRNHVAAQVFIQADEVPGGGFALNGFHGQVAGAYVYPYANASGVNIGPAAPFGFQAGQANSLSDNGFYPNHKWESLPNGTTRFIGFRGVKNGITCYGWMRLTKNSFGNFTVVDWAYENTGASILTGATASASADLSLTENASTLTPITGQTVTFTIIVNNAGPGPATAVEVKNIVPSGLSFVAGSQTGPGTYVSNAPSTTGLRWNAISIPANSAVTLTFQAIVTAANGNIVNFAEVQASAESDPDSTPGNGQ